MTKNDEVNIITNYSIKNSNKQNNNKNEDKILKNQQENKVYYGKKKTYFDEQVKNLRPYFEEFSVRIKLNEIKFKSYSFYQFKKANLKT